MNFITVRELSKVELIFFSSSKHVWAGLSQGQEEIKEIWYLLSELGGRFKNTQCVVNKCGIW